MLTGRKILVVEDDSHVCEVIKGTFSLQNAKITICHDGQEGFQEAMCGEYDVLILDIMLPGKDGLEVCRQLRQEGFSKPIIMLTARVDEVDRILGLEIGADDYVSKPFSPKELVARCKAVIRRFGRVESQLSDVIEIGDLRIKKGQYKATCGPKALEFTPKEFELLAYFAEHPNQTFSREQLLEHVWGFDTESETRTVDEHVKRIRRKLRDAGHDGLKISTVWGVGYQAEVLVNGK